jgi:hypothetical protein
LDDIARSILEIMPILFDFLAKKTERLFDKFRQPRAFFAPFAIGSSKKHR